MIKYQLRNLLVACSMVSMSLHASSVYDAHHDSGLADKIVAVSPHGEQQVQIKEKEGEMFFAISLGGEWEYFFNLSETRRASLLWSPHEAYFYVTDYPDTGESRLLIYCLEPVYGASKKKSLSLIYQTPRIAMENIDWEVKTWNFKRNYVILSCEAESSERGTRSSEEYKIPLLQIFEENEND